MKINRKILKKFLVSLIIAILIEIFICNYPALRTIKAGNTDIKASYTKKDNKITISNIDYRVTSININYREKINNNITYNIKYKAKENSDFISLNSKIMLPTEMQYINFDTYSECQNIEIEFETEADDIQIESILLNHVNFHISLIRIVLLLGFVFLIQSIRNEDIYLAKFDINSRKQKIVSIITIITLFIIIVIYTVMQHKPEQVLLKYNKISKDDSLLMQTESFINGQVELMVEPSEELKQLDNPYDNVERSNKKVPYLYDVAYFNGAYYNYFGVAPILITILPFRLITGIYTHTYIFNLIYILGVMIALYFVYRKLVNKYIKNVSLFEFNLGYIAIFFGANILTLLRGAKYDIVITSGIMFTLISIYLAISIYESEKFKTLKLILLGITLGLMVLSKPTFIIYYLIILWLLFSQMKKQSIKENIIDGIKICIPLGILAILQMSLNYLRFGNLFEFGAKYQLTSLNMITCMQVHFGKIFAGFMEYIFRTPEINPLKFPFVFINTKTSLVSVNEVLYENRLIGLISIPILWVYLFSSKVLKNNKALKKFVRVCFLCVFLGIILSTCFGGICEAYSIDFKLILCICAIIIFFKISEDNDGDYSTNKLYVVLAIITILIMLPISFTTESNFLLNLESSVTVFLKNLFEFWN